MKLYKFSPIETERELLDAINYVSRECHRLCRQSFGRELPVSGNIGIFCHYNEEYAYLTGVRKKLTDEDDSFNQKYFRLHEPIVISADQTTPKMTYNYLYIRQPDPYRHHVGDLDFYLEPAEYEKLKIDMLAGKHVSGARLFDRPDLDMIELHNPDSDVLAYVTPHRMKR